jgi:hypothetical protein
MGSLAKVYSKEKLNGQVYTPMFIVRKMLDDIGYTGYCLREQDRLRISIHYGRM